MIMYTHRAHRMSMLRMGVLRTIMYTHRAHRMLMLRMGVLRTIMYEIIKIL